MRGRGKGKNKKGQGNPSRSNTFFLSPLSSSAPPPRLSLMARLALSFPPACLTPVEKPLSPEYVERIGVLCAARSLFARTAVTTAAATTAHETHIGDSTFQ